MVHRAPDSRLLTNLIAHEKEYVKHLAGLFPLSHSTLASLSAYAAASPSHPSSPAQTITAVVNVLAGADDALQRYNQAIETWREQLVSLKALEDDLTAVLRDRDILVTRLIKASKSTRDAHRSSRLIAPLTGLGSASLSSLPSTSSATAGSASGPASTNSKLAQAQAELQACEAHLVTKERELDARRISIAREGLGARCRALIDCGWVWGEMGKQGLKALQALSANGVASSGHMASKPFPVVSTPAPHLSVNPTPYTSDSSSLTPSQSASQTAAHSVETSHEGPTSKGHEHTTKPDAEEGTKPKPPTTQARTARVAEEGDLTITLPPAHAISEFALPTGVRSQPPQNSDSAGQKPAASNTGIKAIPAPAPAPRRKRTKHSRRPPSQHITEVSDEGSDGPSSTSNRNAGANVNVNANPRSLVSRTPFPTTRAAPGTHDTSSEDEHPIGPFEVVENDPYEVIRRSMLGPSASALFVPTAPSAPSARASVPDVRGDETSPSRTTFPSSGPGQGLGAGLTPGSGSGKRERRTSMAFFGSLRGLFRKPKDRGRLGTEWDEGHSSPSPSPSPSYPDRTQAKANGRGGGGWVTRTDARIKGSRGVEDGSDDEPTPMGMVTTTSVANMARRGSGARLRKGRPGASTRGIQENGTSAGIPVVLSMGVRADGWITDSSAGAGAGSGIGASTGQGGGMGTSTGVGVGRSRTRRGTMKQRKTSVADLRGSDQGHTDVEVADRGMSGRRSLERESSKGRAKAPEASVSAPKPEVDVEQERELARRGSTSNGAPTDTTPMADPNANTNASPGTQPRRATTTTATSSRKPPSDRALAHRRSASVDTHVTFVPTSKQGTHTSTSTGGTMSWRKPPPRFESPSRPESSSQSQTPSQALSRTQTESQPKPNTRRHVGNGHATHAHKHAQNQSLMSIVADVTRQNENEGTDKARSLDIPRAPGSVLREVEGDQDREPSGAERVIGMGVNGRGHARTSSSPMTVGEGAQDGGQVGQGQGQGQGGQRPIKLPLRSALRNASRTPSPSPASVPVPVPVVVQADVKLTQAEGDRGRGITSSSLRDSASISSYETGRESFDAEEREGVPSLSQAIRSQSLPPRSQSQSPPLRSQSHSPAPRPHSPPPRSHTPPLPPLSFSFPPPPVGPPPVPVPVRGETIHSNPEPPPSSSVSTETPPVRRKSVRVSLQPTFSPTPPALCDDDGEEYAPWSRSFSVRDEGEVDGKERERVGRTREREGRKTKMGGGGGGGQEDMWADSSEEDEAYSRARRLLSLVGKHDKAEEGKGKARAKT